MVTIKEIAKELHLSTTTVSNVIHGKSWEVSPATVRRVKEALDRKGYVPNLGARSLAQKESKIIGLALKAQPDKAGNLIQDPFISVLTGAIEREIRNEGYYMMLYVSDKTEEIVRQARSWNVDGLILMGMVDDDGEWMDEHFKRPAVCVDNYSKEGLRRFVNIGLADEEGGYQMTRYLIGLGHRRIAFLSDGRYLPVDLARFDGYRRAIAEAGIDFHEEDSVVYSPFEEEREQSLAKICGQLRHYTAVFCVSDLYAVQLMGALYDRGIRVPEDISVAGFDDTLLGRSHRPALTTVRQDVEEKGVLAVKVIIGLLKGEEPKERDIRLPIHLVPRGSTASPGKKL